MICINCKKLISKGEEIILRDLKVPKFCKQCSEKIAERCHSCRWPIYKNDLLYEIFISRGVEYFVNAKEEEKKILCDSCHRRWLKEQKDKKKKKLVLLFTLIFSIFWLLFIILPLFYPKLKDNWKQTCLFNRFALIGLLIVIPFVTVYLMIQEFSSRYKIRERKG